LLPAKVLENKLVLFYIDHGIARIDVVDNKNLKCFNQVEFYSICGNRILEFVFDKAGCENSSFFINGSPQCDIDCSYELQFEGDDPFAEYGRKVWPLYNAVLLEPMKEMPNHSIDLEGLLSYKALEENYVTLLSVGPDQISQYYIAIDFLIHKEDLAKADFSRPISFFSQD